jgi:hypothetical protein
MVKGGKQSGAVEKYFLRLKPEIEISNFEHRISNNEGIETQSGKLKLRHSKFGVRNSILFKECRTNNRSRANSAGFMLFLSKA